MVSTILKRSIAFSITAWLLVAVGVGDYSLHNFGRTDNYIIAGIIIAPFALTLIMGAIHCFPKKSDYLEKESVPYILFRFSFQRNFDSFCCLAFYVLAFLFALRFDSKFITYGTVYIIACFFIIISADDHSSSVDPNVIESERISVVKVFLLSLALTPIAGYIAVRMYKAEQTQKTDTMKLHLERAKAYLEAKDFTNAILECQEGLNGTGEFGKLREGNFDQREVRYDILHELAEIYCEQEKYSEAIESYHKAMHIFPHAPHKAWDCVSSIVHSKWVYTNKGIAYKALGVLKDYEELYSDEEHFSKERTRLTQIEECASDQYEKSAKAYLEQKDYANAIADYTKAIELAPKDELFNKSYYYNERAWVYFEQEDYANAIADYTKAIELVPEKNTTFTYKASYYDFRAEVYLKQKDYANAIADYTKAIEFASEKNDSFHSKAACYRKRAKVYLEQKDYANAIADYTKAIELNPDWADRYVAARAEVYLKQKDYANAIADYTKAIELADSSHSKAACYRKRAEVYLEQEDYMNAIADYTKAIELKPDWDDYYAARAKVYLAQKDYANAIADCKKAIETNSEFSGAHELLADVYATQEQFASAIESYTNAIETFDSEKIEKKAEIYKKRGEAHQKLGDMEQAEADFAKAKEIEAQE